MGVGVCMMANRLATRVYIQRRTGELSCMILFYSIPLYSLVWGYKYFNQQASIYSRACLRSFYFIHCIHCIHFIHCIHLIHPQITYIAQSRHFPTPHPKTT